MESEHSLFLLSNSTYKAMAYLTVSDVLESMKYGNTTFMRLLQKCNKIIKTYHLK